MNYGFVIDNRKCIGCHACTVACKSEHDVPVGVNRTWVKYIEKGEYPSTRRVFSVMRCNHCADAPCVDICPTKALFTRSDGIVDFDPRRCIGCKACMQACPYDALYIDPETHTAAKCNYCAHRVDLGLEPACVVVCPEHAIVSGDLDNPESEISQLVAGEQVTVRKAEKGTEPKLFYVDGDEVALNPTLAGPENNYMWSSQSGGVGHFARFAEKRVNSTRDEEGQWVRDSGNETSVLVPEDNRRHTMKKALDVLKEHTKRVYDAPSKGVLWGWPVTAYIWTKAVSTGVFLIMFIGAALFAPMSAATQWSSLWTAFIFLFLTGLLLVKDLDQPKRFLYVLLRPNWSSWLVKGGYAIFLYGGFLTIVALATAFRWRVVGSVALGGAAAFAALAAVYTAFLFAQGRGRDFWQSPMLSVHMLLQSLMAGAAMSLLLTWKLPTSLEWEIYLRVALQVMIALNILAISLELFTVHSTADAGRAVRMITRGRFRILFWVGTVVIGHLLPAMILWNAAPALWPTAGILALVGIYITDHMWVKAPQLVPLS